MADPVSNRPILHPANPNDDEHHADTKRLPKQIRTTIDIPSPGFLPRATALSSRSGRYHMQASRSSVLPFCYRQAYNLRPMMTCGVDPLSISSNPPPAFDVKRYNHLLGTPSPGLELLRGNTVDSMIARGGNFHLLNCRRLTV